MAPVSPRRSSCLSLEPRCSQGLGEQTSKCARLDRVSVPEINLCSHLGKDEKIFKLCPPSFLSLSPAGPVPALKVSVWSCGDVQGGPRTLLKSPANPLEFNDCRGLARSGGKPWRGGRSGEVGHVTHTRLRAQLVGGGCVCMQRRGYRPMSRAKWPVS